MTQKTVDLTITNGRLVLPDRVTMGTLVIEGGLIAGILPQKEPVPPSRITRDVGGAYVLPGLIDSHVHFRTPGFVRKETWENGSRAAIAGGVTTVADMPNTMPHFSDPRELNQRVDALCGRSLVDHLFYLGVSPESLPLLATADLSSFPAVKVFLATHHTARHLFQQDCHLDSLFRIAASQKIPLLVHSEDQATLDLLGHAVGRTRTLTEHEARHGRTAAIIALSRVLRLVERYGTRTHILHVSAADEVDLLEAAAVSGLPVTFEVTHHHLTFTCDDEQLGAFGKIRPPLRHEADRDRLWEAVLKGSAETIGSDHAPHTRDEKLIGFEDAPPGLPGVQELAPAFLTSLQRMAPQLTTDQMMLLLSRLAARNPARLLGIHDRKGALLPGYDADASVFHPQARWTVHRDSLEAYCRWSAYEGRTLRGAPSLVVRRGQLVLDHGNFGPPEGVWLPSRR